MIFRAPEWWAPGSIAPAIGIATLVAAWFALLACSGPVTPTNVILIISDDHGYPYYGFMGSDVVQTPHLDRLAREGTIFRNGYVTASACRPSLMSLLTGLHPEQWNPRLRAGRSRGVERPGHDAIQAAETLPRLLGRRGYRSFQGRKYWEGSYDFAGFTHGMKDTLGDEMVEKWGTALASAGADSLNLGRTTMNPLLDFLDANRDSPFFVWFAPMLPQGPFNAPPEYSRLYAGQPLTQAASRYYANISWLDGRVGQPRCGAPDPPTQS